MRKWAIHNLAAILKQHKRKHPKTEVDLKEQAVAVSQEETPFCGPRPDNHWICYDSYQRPGNSSFLIKEPCYASVLNRSHVATIWNFDLNHSLPTVNHVSLPKKFQIVAT